MDKRLQAQAWHRYNSETKGLQITDPAYREQEQAAFKRLQKALDLARVAA